MSSKEINYRKAAFLHPWNLTFLVGAMSIALVASAVLPGEISGDFFRTLLIFAAGAELLVLGAVPSQKRFRNIVKARWAKERAKPPTSRELFAELGRENQRRYAKLDDLQKKIAVNYRKFSYASQGLLDSHISKLHGLLSSCLAMMHQKERYDLYSSRVKEREVLEDMVQLQEEMEDASDHIRRIKLRRLKVLEQRLARFKKSQEHLEILNEQIDTIEDVVDYIHEQSMTLQNPEQISIQLDVLLTDVAETEASLGQIESAFGDPSLSLSGDLDVFGIEEETPGGTGTLKHRSRTS